MKQHADITLNKNTFYLKGSLDFSNVMSVYQKSISLLESEGAKEKNCIFDFSNLQSSNSAALAFMLEWLKLTKKLNKTLSFMHVSADIISVANAANLDELLGFK